MGRLTRAAGSALVTLLLLVGVSLNVHAQGPYSAQIQAALRNFLTLTHTWTATQTFQNITVSGTCTGCGGGITAADTQVIFSDGANNPVGNAALTFAKTTGTLSTTIGIATSYFGDGTNYRLAYNSGNIFTNRGPGVSLANGSGVDASGPLFGVQTLFVGNTATYSGTNNVQITIQNGNIAGGSNGGEFNLGTLAGVSNNPGLALSNNKFVCWATTTTSIGGAGTIDLGLYRNAAGVLEINSGTAGTFRDLKARNYVMTGGIVDATDNTKVWLPSLSGMTTGVTLTLSSAQSTSQTLTIPNITGADTLDAIGLAQTITGAKTFTQHELLIRNPANTQSYTLQAAAITAARTLTLPLTTQAETLAVVPQATTGVSASPVGNVSTTEKAMGLGLVSGFTLTPSVTGNVVVVISGIALNGTAIGDGTNITCRFGTGTAPSNGATSGLGTAFGTVQHYIAPTTLAQAGFTCMGRITGNAIGTALWFDVSLVAVTGGGSTVKDVQIIAFEQ